MKKLQLHLLFMPGPSNLSSGRSQPAEVWHFILPRDERLLYITLARCDF